MGEQDANYRFADEATIEPDHISRARAHALEPIVHVGHGGVTNAVLAEIERALTAH